MIDGLLLDPDHPRAGLPDTMITWLQQMHTECLAQLAVFPQGRAALLAELSVLEALQHVKEVGRSEVCRELAESALLALRDHAPDFEDLGHQGSDHDGPKHVMLSCERCRAVLCVTRVQMQLTPIETNASESLDAWCVDQWSSQICIKRINISLKRRSYLVWIDLEMMKGSTMVGCILALN